MTGDIDPHMVTLAANVVHWSVAARAATTARDGAIRAMRDGGASLQAIAIASEMTKQGVARVLKRTTSR